MYRSIWNRLLIIFSKNILVISRLSSTLPRWPDLPILLFASVKSVLTSVSSRSDTPSCTMKRAIVTRRATETGFFMKSVVGGREISNVKKKMFVCNLNVFVYKILIGVSVVGKIVGVNFLHESAVGVGVELLVGTNLVECF